MDLPHAWTHVRQLYVQRSVQYRGERERLVLFEKWLSLLRVALFLTAILCIGLAWAYATQRTLWLLAGGVGVVGFVVAISYHERLLQRIRQFDGLQRINEQSIARMDRRWDGIPLPYVERPAKHEAVVRDLDLLGRASLFHLLGTPYTPLGLEILRDWLLQPASPEEIAERQQSVRDLAGQLELRQELQLRGRRLVSDKPAPMRFVRWAEGEQWLADRPWLKWAARILPSTILLSVIAWLIGFVRIDAAFVALAGLLLVNAALSVAFTGKVHDIFNQVSTRRNEVQQYLDLFHLIYELRAGTGALATIQQAAADRGGGVVRRLRQLGTIMRLAHLRQPLQFVVYLALQTFLLWDFHILDALEHWQRKFGRYCRCWFEALGQFEVLASLASLAHDQPHWAFPVVTADANQIEAKSLGHPLIPEERRVLNDVTLGPPGTFLLVTGSNMSGKSTLLRTIGLNVLLAQCGGPVCAETFRIPPLQVTTSMRINDSLVDGVSFFMAELRRLKEIVDEAETFHGRADRRLLYLLDEILQGTNSRERHIAVVQVMSHLLKHDALGAISTHDLELASSPSLQHSCRAVYFTETLHASGPQRMTFDYKLHPGVAPTTNAIKLLQLVGLAEVEGGA